MKWTKKEATFLNTNASNISRTHTTQRKRRRCSVHHFVCLFVLSSVAYIWVLYFVEEPLLSPVLRRPSPITPPPSCYPVRHILFLKTHKTGSSTVTNLFFRFGDERNLTFVFPPAPFIRLGWPERFRVSYSLPLFNEKPNILCSHARYNKKPMNWLLPKETSKYVTILRNPVDNFESNFNFGNLGKFFGFPPDKGGSLEKFLRKGTSSNRTDPLARNPMLFDLGLSYKFYQNLSAVKEYIQFLDKEFDLVMIMDYFDESLVLLRRLLCWDMDDILYVSLNERREEEKTKNLSDNVKENIKRWNKADVLLFNHFKQALFQKIEMEGQGFYKELALFRQKKDEIKFLCLKNGTSLHAPYPGKLVKGYSVRDGLPERLKDVCSRMIRMEVPYVNQLRKQYFERLLSNGLNTEQKLKDETGWEVAQDLVYKPV